MFSSEWDQHAQKTYKAWFGDLPAGDITKIDPASIPDHDILAAGFPCQPFSIAGVSKKNSLGRAHGFKDVAQGTLFFHVVTIAKTLDNGLYRGFTDTNGHVLARVCRHKSAPIRESVKKSVES